MNEETLLYCTGKVLIFMILNLFLKTCLYVYYYLGKNFSLEDFLEIALDMVDGHF